jgi:hypothetical protein
MPSLRCTSSSWLPLYRTSARRLESGSNAVVVRTALWSGLRSRVARARRKGAMIQRHGKATMPLHARIGLRSGPLVINNRGTYYLGSFPPLLSIPSLIISLSIHSNYAQVSYSHWHTLTPHLSDSNSASPRLGLSPPTLDSLVDWSDCALDATTRQVTERTAERNAYAALFTSSTHRSSLTLSMMKHLARAKMIPQPTAQTPTSYPHCSTLYNTLSTASHR